MLHIMNKRQLHGTAKKENFFLQFSTAIANKIYAFNYYLTFNLMQRDMKNFFPQFFMESKRFNGTLVNKFMNSGSFNA